VSLTGALFAIAFCVGCVLAFTRHPIWGAMTYVATFFLSPDLRWWGQGALGEFRWAYIAAIVTLVALLLTKRAARPTVPLLRHGIAWAYLLFVAWLFVQSFWALDQASQHALLTYYVKFCVALALVYYCVDSEKNLRLLLWTHVCGCFYIGWIAHPAYTGGRFGGFGGAGIGEANAGALALVTGILVGSSLFLVGRPREKVMVFCMIPFIVDGLITTISRSGFLELAVGGVTFNWFTPKKLARVVRILSVLAIVLFLILSGPAYWKRMHSIEYAAKGEQDKGMTTGQNRIALWKAQWRMFEAYPLGCGSMCTAVLSPHYLARKYLAQMGNGSDVMARSSHSTAMSLLVEQGVPGVIFYVIILGWTYKTLRQLARSHARDGPGTMSTVLPAVAAIMAAITVGDVFVSYMKLEIRVWFIAVLMAMLNLDARARAAQSVAQEEVQASPARPALQMQSR
jgi:hypothetical protein